MEKVVAPTGRRVTTAPVLVCLSVLCTWKTEYESLLTGNKTYLSLSWGNNANSVQFDKNCLIVAKSEGFDANLRCYPTPTYLWKFQTVLALIDLKIQLHHQFLFHISVGMYHWLASIVMIEDGWLENNEHYWEVMADANINLVHA